MIKDPEDIAALPWQGNFRADRALFQAIEDFIFAEPDPAKRRRADQLAALHGCGQRTRCLLDYDPRR
jgi:hypothetical protein